MHILVAAAVPEGSVVKIPEDLMYNQEYMTIIKIQYGTPRPGSIAWYDEDNLEVIVKANLKLEVKELP